MSLAGNMRTPGLGPDLVHWVMEEASRVRSVQQSVARIADRLLDTSPWLAGPRAAAARDSLGRRHEASKDLRHGTGTFYTGGAEAAFMCRESLRCHLAQACPRVAPAAILRALYGVPAPLGSAQRLQLADALTSLTVHDPAVGAGDLLVAMARVVHRCIGQLAVEAPAAERAAQTARFAALGLRGTDVDRRAVVLCGVRLLLELVAMGLPRHRLPVIGPQLRCTDGLRRSRGDERCDIVVTNPPYVRQELIDQALRAAGSPHTKQTLLRAYRQRFGDAVCAASDLYVYFMVRAHELAAPGGTVCTLTSNSWLDVTFGAGLRRFLRDSGCLVAVYDNASVGSFDAADVNTVVTVWRPGPPPSSDHTVKFVTLTVPFSGVGPALAQAIHEARTSTAPQGCRLVVMRQAELCGSAPGRGGQPPGSARAVPAERWGARFLRAPSIHAVVEEKGRRTLAMLGELASVRRGFTSGANEFFYPTPQAVAQWGIEDAFLEPFLFSLRDVRGYRIAAEGLARRVFVCGSGKEELQRAGFHGALAYIRWGESRGFDRRPSVCGRSPWYALRSLTRPDFVSNRFLGRRLAFPVTAGVPVGDVFFALTVRRGGAAAVVALANSSVSYLSAEALARKTYGTGVAYLYGPEVRDVRMPDPCALPVGALDEVTAAFGLLCRRSILRIDEEVACNDRRRLDAPVFDALGLTRGERDGVYEALVTLVDQRLRKAAAGRGRVEEST